MDKNALKILLKYKSFSRETRSFYIPTEEEFEFAKREGLMFDSINLTLRQSVEWLFESLEKVEKTDVVSLFLASLSTNRVDWRCGLSAYALCKNLPKPDYSVDFKSPIETFKEIDLSLDNQTRFSSGCGMYGCDYFDYNYLAFCLDQHLRLPIVEPQIKDISIFKTIIDTVLEMREEDTPNDLEKKLASKKAFKSSHWQRRYLLETLGFCSVIESPNAQGYLENFIPKEKRHLDNHMSEWNYPIRIWRGHNGINKKALQYWFGGFI
jgi:hypothetical protein